MSENVTILPVVRVERSDDTPVDTDLFRLLRAVMRFVDRHAETKDGPGVVQVPLLPHEMKELRRSLEPFRPRYKEWESLGRKRLAEICDGARPTGDETAIRDILNQQFSQQEGK